MNREKFYDTECYESSKIEQVFEEFQNKCKEIILNDVKVEIDFIKQRNESLKKENETLKQTLTQKEKNIKELKNNAQMFSLFEELISNIKNTVKNSINKDETIYSFLNFIFQKDYNESVYDTPLWLGAMTQFYSHKEKVIEILKMFDIELPSKIENFRLPTDWNEEEMNIFFDTMKNHFNCNSCKYAGNLRFWGEYSLKDVKNQCYRNYSEIPWQYVLRNPVLKKKKYLVKIGENAYNMHWDSFYRIDNYIDLSSEEIKTILTNIPKLMKKDEVAYFVLRNLKYVEEDKMLENIYSLFHDSYDFKYYKLLEMPYKYTLKWVCEHKKEAIKFIEEKKEHFTEEQRKELLMKALEL